MTNFFPLPAALRRGLGQCLVLLGGLLAAAPLAAQAQTGNVGIGTTAPDVSAALDIVSSTKGALLPRVADATALATPATGLLVFQTNAPAGFYYNAGTPAAPSWQRLATGSGGAGDNLGNHTATQALNLQGNALVGTGSSVGAVGVGVRADGGLNLGENNNDNIYLGYQAGDVSTGFSNVYVGSQAGLVNTMGFNNVYLGTRSGLASTTGSNNLFSGHQSGRGTTTGSNNVFSGSFSGRYNTTGSTNTALGYASGPAPGSSNLTNATALGANVGLTQSNTVVLGNGASVGIGTSSPSQKLEVAGQVFSSTGGFRFPDNTVQTTAATPTASNGLTQTGNNIALGGTLTQPTSIAQAGNDFSLTGGNVGIGTTAAPAAKLEVVGDVRIPAASNYTYAAARPHTVLLGGFDFHAENGTTSIYSSVFNSDYIYLFAMAGGVLRAPLHLPQGAIVTGITLLAYDNEAANITAELISYEATNEFAKNVALATASTAGYRYIADVPSATIAAAIDNENNAYSVRVSFGTGSAVLYLRGVKVSYTTTRVE